MEFSNKKKNAEISFNKAASMIIDENNWDSVSVQAEENMKTENLFRTAINTPEKRRSFYGVFIPYFFVSVVVILIIMSLSLSFSADFQSRTILEKNLCMVSGTPNVLGSHATAIHTLYRFLDDSATLGQVVSVSKAQVTSILKNVGDVLAASTTGSFIPQVMEIFTEAKWKYVIPRKQIVGEMEADMSSYMNISVLEYLNFFEKNGYDILFQLDNLKKLNDTTDNFSLLFFLYNRLEMADAFDNFCSSFIEGSMEGV